MSESAAIAVLWVVGGGFLAQWAGARLRIPSIALLLGVGLLAGPGLEMLHPSEGLGTALRPIIGLAVAIVVFEGGLALDVRELRAAGQGVFRLTVYAVPLNAVLATAAGHFVGGLSWAAATLFGVIVVVTGPTVVLPLLRQSRLERRTASFLKWEAIVNDPVGAILSALALEVLTLTASAYGAEAALWTLVLRVASGVVAAVALGIGAAYLVRLAFQRDLVPEVLKTPMLLSTTLIAYTAANLVMEESGLIAATLFGVALTNLRVPGILELRRFKEALVVLIVSALFIVLAADLDRAALARLSWPIVLLTATTLFVVRPVAIFLATIRSGLTGPERLLAAWIGPRGIVAAAVAGLAGLRLGEAGYQGAELVQPTVFAVIAASVVLHGFTLGPLARRLGLAVKTNSGLAIVGASRWSVDLAGMLAKLNIPVVVVDLFPGAVHVARRQGLKTLQAEAISEEAREAMAEAGTGYVLAATRDELYNAMVCTRMAPDVGRERVYQLAPRAEHLTDPHEGLARDWRGKVFAGAELDYETMERRYREGWRFTTSGLSSDDPSQAMLGLPLLAVRKDGRLDIASPEHGPFSVEDGETLISFSPPDEELPAAREADGRIAAAEAPASA